MITVTAVKLAYIFALLLNITNCFQWDEDGVYAKEADKERLTNFLFPNRTVIQEVKHTLRHLAIEKEPWDAATTYPCTKCAGLTSCSVLNGLVIEEKYYPGDISRLETCQVLDSLGARLSKELFGNGRTFRDLPLCRDMAMQYLCLFYGSNNAMYRNYCPEDTTAANSDLHEITPKAPCRSFCVQVATICANDPTFIQLCEGIKCPPTEDVCQPDPVGLSDSANLGCSVPYYRTPYNTASQKPSPLRNMWVYIVLFVLSYYFVLQ